MSQPLRFRFGVRLLRPWLLSELQRCVETNSLHREIGTPGERYWMGRCTSIRRVLNLPREMDE